MKRPVFISLTRLELLHYMFVIKPLKFSELHFPHPGNGDKSTITYWEDQLQWSMLKFFASFFMWNLCQEPKSGKKLMGTLSLVVGSKRRWERTWLQDVGALLPTPTGLPGRVKVSLPARMGLSPRSYVRTHTSGLCPIPCPSLFQILLSPRPTWPVGIRPQCVCKDSTWGGAGTVLGPRCRLSTCWQRWNTKRCLYQMSKGLRTHLFQRFPHSTEFTEMPPVHLLQPSTRMWKWLRLTC